MSGRVYFGDWQAPREFWGGAFDGEKHEGYAAMRADFDEKDIPPAGDVLFAFYSYENYSGYAFVLFQRGDDVFEVNGSHCSCNGLEGQWDPKPTTWAALSMRKMVSGQSEYYGMDEEALAALRALVAERASPEVAR